MARDDLAYPRREPDQAGEDVRVRNWARNATLGAPGSVSAPRTEDELRTLLTSTHGGVRVIGSRMSPGRMLSLAAQGDMLLDLSHLRGLVELGEDRATFAAATTLSEVYACLTAQGRMLPAAPGVIAHQTLAGALATGTHGQGLEQSCIADAAVSVRMVLADGSVADFGVDHPWFGAVKLGLGLLGVVTQVTLRTVPSPVYSCRKAVTSASTLETDLLTWNREHVTSKAWWFPDQDQVHVWTAQEASDADVARYRAGGSVLLEEQVTSAVLNSTVDSTLVHMRGDTKIREADGKPFQTVNRFKDFSDVTGDVYQVFCRGIATPQINVEIGVPLASAGRVVAAIKAWHAETRPHMHYPVILRATGASDSWLSPAYGQETCFFGFVVYYAEDGSLSPEGVDFLRAVERVLADEAGRPHWGKYFDESLYDWSSLYPRWAEFRGVRAALDPGHRFENAFTAELFAPGRTPDARAGGDAGVKAWATLLTQPSYLVGVRALRASLARVGSAYPLVVAVTDGIGAADRAVLEAEGCLLREVEPLRPPSGLQDSYANARFAEVWTKLGVWRLTEFERLVVLDADMLVTQDMDELFDLPLGDEEIAACHACRCNPNRIASYPASWTPAGCAYTYLAGAAPGAEVDVVDPYFNGGILVLRPDLATFDALLGELAAVDDLSRYVFAEQDFLNEHFHGRWVALPYVYNALKTLPFQHPELWDGAAVKNIHFIIDKPWESELDPTSRYAELERQWWDVAADLVPRPVPARA